MIHPGLGPSGAYRICLVAHPGRSGRIAFGKKQRTAPCPRAACGVPDVDNTPAPVGGGLAGGRNDVEVLFPGSYD